MESEDESDSDLDYDVKQKPKKNKRKKHFKVNKDEELKEKVESSENSDEYNFKERPPPEPPPDLPSTSGLSKPQKNVIECRDQLTMRKDNYAYFITTNGEPRDIGAKLLGKCNKLPKFETLQKGLVKVIRKGQQYHLELPIESENEENLGETTRNIKLAIYSLHSTVEKLNLKSISHIKNRISELFNKNNNL